MEKKHLQRKRNKFYMFLITLIYFVLCSTLSPHALEYYRDFAGNVVGTSDSRLAATIIETDAGVILQVIGVGEMMFDVVEYAFFLKQGKLVLSDKTFTQEFGCGAFSSSTAQRAVFEESIEIRPELMRGGSLNLDFQLSGKTQYRQAGERLHADFSSVAGMDALIVAVSSVKKSFELPKSEITPIFTCYLKKLTPGKLDSTDIGIGVKNTYTGGRFCPKWNHVLTLAYADIDVPFLQILPGLFVYRSPSSVAMDAASQVSVTTAILNGSFKRGDMTPANNLLEGLEEASGDDYQLRYNGRLTWDQVIQHGFIYTEERVDLSIKEYSDTLLINGKKYLFPDTLELEEGKFTRGDYTFYIISEVNSDTSGLVGYSASLSNLNPNTTYSAWSYIKYVFETSRAYPKIGNPVRFTTWDDCYVVPTNSGALIAWRPNENAGGYKLMIYTGEARTDLIFTFEFNASGQWIKTTPNIPGSAGSDFNYTIENLTSGTIYYYTLKAFGADNTELASTSGDFVTISGSTGIVETQCIASLPSVVGYYSITGTKLPKEPANGIYIIMYDNGTTVKVMRLK